MFGFGELPRRCQCTKFHCTRKATDLTETLPLLRFYCSFSSSAQATTTHKNVLCMWHNRATNGMRYDNWRNLKKGKLCVNLTISIFACWTQVEKEWKTKSIMFVYRSTLWDTMTIYKLLNFFSKTFCPKFVPWHLCHFIKKSWILNKLICIMQHCPFELLYTWLLFSIVLLSKFPSVINCHVKRILIIEVTSTKCFCSS